MLGQHQVTVGLLDFVQCCGNLRIGEVLEHLAHEHHLGGRQLIRAEVQHPEIHIQVGMRLTAFVAIRNDGGVHCREVAPALRQLPEVLELHSVAGEHDFLAKIRTTHARALEDVIYQIKAIEGVARTTSTVVLSTAFEDRPLDLGKRLPGKTPTPTGT